ncbi:MAG TPA: beta-phosphoglucomutase [Candidatus Enteromonas pullicola]|uniref:Beta-phosphoglucomutase n=1 Tax=Candidatus Alloenteromonas pullicola TaxID=2840784 RepID=A0A9D1LNM1_9FIRM|nr:beta-phosphoglucomutase [Candidatus Enteromonas pullicola]
MIKGIVFDLDGVLVFTDEYHYLAWKEVFNEEGLRFDREMNNKLRGVSRRDSLEIVLKENGASIPEQRKQRILKTKNDIYVAFLNDRLSPDSIDPKTRAALEEFRGRGIKLAVGSSSKNAKLILGKTGMLGMFDVICDGTMISNSKPDPEVFVKAASMIGLKPKDCIVVEDGEAGIIAAKRGGFIPVAIGSEISPELAEIRISSITDISRLI